MKSFNPNSNGINGNLIRCYNCQGEGHYASNCIVKPRKQDAAYLQHQLQMAQEEEAGIQSIQEEFNFMASVDTYEEIEKVTANCNLQDNLQQASTSGTQSDKAPVYDTDGSAEYTELLEPISEPHQVPQNDSNVISKVSSVEQASEVEKVNSVNRKMKETNAELTTELARYKNQEKYDKLERCYEKSVYQEQCLTKKINALHLSSEAAKFVRDFKSIAKEADDSLAKHKALELEIQRLLRAFVSRQKDTTCGTSANTKFVKQLILGEPPSSSRPKLHAVTPLSKSIVFPKVGETHALSKPVTSNSVPTLTESKFMKNNNVISPGIFRINPFKAFKEVNFVPNKHVKASIRTKSITISQPYVITKNDVNSKTNDLSPKDVKSTTRTIRPQPKNNPKNDKSWKVYLVIYSMNYSNGENQVVSKSSVVTTTDTSDKRQQQQYSPSSTTTLATTITVDGNFGL
nr:hypothetical protein [Tanacetum cinerariifolium]